MKTIDVIRHENLLQLIGEAGSVQAVATRAGKSNAQISQLKTRSVHSGTGKPRSVGDLLARELEKAFNKPTGWMDAPHDHGSEIASTATPVAIAAQDYILIPMMDAAPKMGLGGVLPDYDMVIDGLRLSKDWVRQNLPTITSPKNLAVLSAFGDSMSPTLNDGDILLVDSGVHELKLDAVYVLALNDELYVKRVQRRITDGAVTIKSDNVMYDPVTVTNHEKDALRVLGRVVWAWNARKL